MSKPRKAKPSRNVVTFVFSELSSKPSRSRNRCSTAVRASLASASLRQSTTKSSAYRTKRKPRSWRCQSSTLRAMFASSGEATPPCGVPTRVARNLPPSKTPALRNFSQDDQVQDVPVGDHRGQFRHHRTVRQVIEESADVGVEYVIVPLPPEFEHPLDRLMTTSARPEAVRVVVKLSLEDRVQEATNHLLSDPITHSRDSQRPKLAGAFGNVDPPRGQRLERPCFEF